MTSNKSKIQFPNKKQFIITIPKSLVLAKRWSSGDLIEFTLDETGNIVMKKCEEKEK